MKTDVVKYKSLHAFELLDRQVQEQDFCLSSIGDWEAAAMRWEYLGPSFTLLVDSVVEACGGIMISDDTMGECWLMIPSTKHAIIVYRHIARAFCELIKKHKFRRLNAFIMDGFENGARLAKRLGFEEHARLEKYGPGGETVYLYGMVF